MPTIIILLAILLALAIAGVAWLIWYDTFQTRRRRRDAPRFRENHRNRLAARSRLRMAFDRLRRAPRLTDQRGPDRPDESRD